MNDRPKVIWGAITAFLVVTAFGIGVISMAAFGNEEGGSVAASAAGDAPSDSVEVELGDLFIEPGTIEVASGEATLQVTNSGATQHNLAVEGGPKTKMLDSGASAELGLGGLDAGTYTVICEVPGHAGGGMEGTLVVGEGGGEGGGASTTEETDDSGMAGMSPQQMLEHDAEVTGSFPAETKGKGGVDLEPEIADDGTKVYKLIAEEIRWETEPGKVQSAYAYNGMVPGPTLRPELGDMVRIELKNELPEPTTMHFHGMTVPAEMDGVPVINQRAILPGETFTYEFEIRNTGSNMYHSHFNAQSQVPKGLLGALIVPDEKDPAVALDYTMILNDGPLGFTLNGKGFPATEPIAVQKGDLVRIRYMNEGLQIHPMHLHGMPQEVIAKDGHLLPASARHMEDTVLVAPGERVDVLVRATETGTWAFHCHILTHAESENGMFGMVTGFIVE
jgi:uncharacterized cupredoxin-like copper-binding protein